MLLLIGWNDTALCSTLPPPKRIVSLAPAVTEIIFSLGLGERVVGVTTVCHRPDEARSKTKIGGMANPSIEAIVALNPDMVVMTSAGNRKALFVILPSPLIVAGPGTILDDAMKMSGMSNIASDAKVPYPRFSLEAVIERRPDLILIGAGHDDMKTLANSLLKRLGMLEALRKGQVCFLGDALYRPGPRIPAGMEELKRCGKMP